MYVVKYETPTKAQKIVRKFFVNAKVDETHKFFNAVDEAIRFARYFVNARVFNLQTNQEVNCW